MMHVLKRYLTILIWKRVKKRIVATPLSYNKWRLSCFADNWIKYSAFGIRFPMFKYPSGLILSFQYIFWTHSPVWYYVLNACWSNTMFWYYISDVYWSTIMIWYQVSYSYGWNIMIWYCVSSPRLIEYHGLISGF